MLLEHYFTTVEIFEPPVTFLRVQYIFQFIYFHKILSPLRKSLKLNHCCFFFSRQCRKDNRFLCKVKKWHVLFKHSFFLSCRCQNYFTEATWMEYGKQPVYLGCGESSNSAGDNRGGGGGEERRKSVGR